MYIDAPGEFHRVNEFLEKKLADERGVRSNLGGTFKGFIVQ